MRRVLPFLVLALVGSAWGPAAAWADNTYTVTPSQTGASLSITVPANQSARVTFSGTVGERVSANSSNWTWGDRNSQISVLNPDGTTLLKPQYFGSSGYPFMDTITLSQSGTTTLLITSITGISGSMTLTVYQVPADFSQSISPTATGVGVTVETTTPGQNARITFTGMPGERISVNSSTWPWGDRNSRISVINPDGTTLLNPQYFGSSGYPFMDDVTLSQSGSYTIVIDPIGAATTGTAACP